jgi:uncharacterized protein YigA (DUF484 family)
MEQLQEQINKLQEEINKLKSTTSIPFEVDNAFRDRFGIADFAKIVVSSKSATSENVTAVTSVDFLGESTLTNTVLDNPDIYLQVMLNGTMYYFPAYTS